jgi:hypothetical protein
MEAALSVAIVVGVVLGIVVLAILFGLYVFNFDNLIEKVWTKKAEIANDNRRAAEARAEEARAKAGTTHQ